MIGIIVLSILLGICVLLLILFGRAILFQHMTLTEIQKYLNNLEFLNGGKIDDDLVLNRYYGTLIIGCQLAQQDGSIWDISLYEKKRIIGLTIFVTKETILNKLMINSQKFVGYNMEEISEMIVQLLQEINNEVDINPCTEVVQFKDGTWLFRSVKQNENND